MPVMLWIVGFFTACAIVILCLKFHDPGDRRIARRIGRSVAGFALFLAVMSCVEIVPANQVGISTVFGRWHGTLDSGLHAVIPWSQVDSFPTRNQKSIRDKADGNYSSIPVKLKGGAKAEVDATILYTIDEKQAEVLWKGWGSFQKINEDLINRSSDDAAALVFGQYSSEGALNGENRQAITDAMTDRLRAKLKNSGVELGSITLGDIHLPTEVQSLLDQILQADVRIQVANRREEEARAEARANAARQGSLTREALIKECLDTMREIKPQVPAPCGLGSDTNSSIILPSR